MALLVNAVVTADDEELQDWITARLNTTLGPMVHAAQPSVATIGTSQVHGQMHPSAADMGAVIGRSVVVAVQTLTPASTVSGGAMTGSDTTTKEKYLPDKVDALLGFVHVDAAHILLQF